MGVIETKRRTAATMAIDIQKFLVQYKVIWQALLTILVIYVLVLGIMYFVRGGGEGTEVSPPPQPSEPGTGGGAEAEVEAEAEAEYDGGFSV